MRILIDLLEFLCKIVDFTQISLRTMTILPKFEFSKHIPWIPYSQFDIASLVVEIWVPHLIKKWNCEQIFQPCKKFYWFTKYGDFLVKISILMVSGKNRSSKRKSGNSFFYIGNKKNSLEGIHVHQRPNFLITKTNSLLCAYHTQYA